MNNLFSMKITREKKQIEREEYREEEEVKRSQGRERDREKETDRDITYSTPCAVCLQISMILYISNLFS